MVLILITLLCIKHEMNQEEYILKIWEFWKFFINIWTHKISVLVFIYILLRHTNFLTTYYLEQWMIWDFSLLLTMEMNYENYLSVGKHKQRTKNSSLYNSNWDKILLSATYRRYWILCKSLRPYFIRCYFSQLQLMPSHLQRVNWQVIKNETKI